MKTSLTTRNKSLHCSGSTGSSSLQMAPIAASARLRRIGSGSSSGNVLREDEPRRVALEVMIRGTCDKVRLLDLVENFTLFSEHKAGLVKIIGQNHQFLGVNNTIASVLAARASGHGRGGAFWQTPGSGKSFWMV